ncbi:unnamed protein product [[Actinomadura] parvosata subsp. kistnae]|uniref:Uncharacterized protein n=1 Tax=[Actinomadura] parvosata subsp. kistnae TaxID=1909395 RepID=A0A1V0ADC4_9ACTN|nr:hypothetical protein [Nonomuraea sp. ATCC 55076]AQZ68230.1 hypothetical protein BKM31_48245 [Nonomuraea sp. ATCC 55076]SPL93362.1 unnamed protein product [Actinomadura parvosata subsp. kistnae]
MLTIEQAIATFGVTVDEHLDRQAEIPVLSGLQFQGDVAVVPVTASPARTPIPAEGVPVVRGQAQANTHLLVATGPAFFTPDRSGRALTLGVLTVEEGATAYLAHPEHAYAGIAPGTYELRRQREQADQTRLVAD